MNSYIPGPWKVTSAASGGISVDAVDPADGRGFELCEVWGVDRDKDALKDDRAKANANLIAAAPDLLASLEHLMAVIAPQGDERYLTISLTPEYFERARTAIAKAKGQSK